MLVLFDLEIMHEQNKALQKLISGLIFHMNFPIYIKPEVVYEHLTASIKIINKILYKAHLPGHRMARIPLSSCKVALKCRNRVAERRSDVFRLFS